MHSKLLSLTLGTSLIGSSAATFGFFQNSNGATRLLGTSFGAFGTNASYDYVIIGGGTAGLTLANRLTENGTLSVAVIEAGGFYEMSNGNLSQIPAYDFYYSSAAPTTVQPLVDWGIVTTPQSQLQDRELHYAAGKCFGGGSARNFLAYQRGSAGSYQQWADQVGDQAWNFTNVLPYFQKSVNFSTPDYAKRGGGGNVSYDASAFSPGAGPLHVSYANYWQPIATYVRKAFISLGVKPIAGFNSGILNGYTEFTSTIDPTAATRSSSETAFLSTALTRPNLAIYPQTMANKILFDENKNAVGVSVTTAGVSFVLSAKKEVILSAGVFKSPQVLMLSGIGPAATLEAFNIPAVSVLEGVGQNLQDQPLFGVTVRVNVTTQSALFTDATYAAQMTAEYLNEQKGPLSLPGGTVAAFEKLPQPFRRNLSNATLGELSAYPADWPELELLPLGETFVATSDKANYMEVAVALLTTSSRGNITLNSTNPNDNPLVSPNWLLTKADQELAVQGFKRARQIVAATGISSGAEYSPGVSVQTDAQILSFIQSSASPVHHATSTNSMGQAGDANAVIDTQARVFGVSGLRVVDASSFPLLPPGHCQSTVYMLAEKIAADILGA